MQAMGKKASKLGNLASQCSFTRTRSSLLEILLSSTCLLLHVCKHPEYRRSVTSRMQWKKRHLITWTLLPVPIPCSKKVKERKKGRFSMLLLKRIRLLKPSPLPLPHPLNEFCHLEYKGTNDSAARILLLWNPSLINIKVLSNSSQSILCHITHQSLSLNFFATFVYASNDRKERELLWCELQANLAMIGSSKSWIILGDFNVVKSEHERKGGKGIDKQATQEFNDCLEAIEVTDLRFLGCLCTWNNKQEEWKQNL